jgi:hypothetical protein
MTTTGAPGARRIVNYGRAAYLAGYFVFGAIGIVRIIRFNASGTLQTAGQPIHHVSDWLAANAPDSSVVMARQAASLNLTTHRKTVPFPLTTSVDVMRGAVQSLRPTFLVVVDSAWNDYYHPTEPARLALIEQALNAPLKQRARVLGAAIYEFPATSGIRVTP